VSVVYDGQNKIAFKMPYSIEALVAFKGVTGVYMSCTMDKVSAVILGVK